MAHVKAGGRSKNGRNSPGQRLGIKLYAGEMAGPGDIILRQVGTKWHAGSNVKLAKNDSIYAVKTGVVSYKKKQVKDFTGRLVQRTFISVTPEANA